MNLKELYKKEDFYVKPVEFEHFSYAQLFKNNTWAKFDTIISGYETLSKMLPDIEDKYKDRFLEVLKKVEAGANYFVIMD